MSNVKRRSRIGLTAAVLILVPTSIGGGASAQVTSAVPGMRDCWLHTTGEKGLTSMMNGARASSGARPLNLDKHLSNAARVHTQEMINDQTLYHTPSGKLASRVTKWRLLGENVGVGSTVESLNQAFMNSPAHKANVLDAGFTHVGVGVQFAGGRTWITVIFTADRNPGTSIPMPTC